MVSLKVPGFYRANVMAYIIDSDARLIANHFLELGTRDGSPIDPMKIQKLVYLAHGWNLAFYGGPLVSQPVEAWRYGPVVPDLYQEFRAFRAGPITRKANSSGHLIPQTTNLLESVWQTYRGYSAVQLSMLTHEPGGAWDLTIKSSGGLWGSPIIPNDLIAEEFKRKQQQT
jgi:uncharacterized phage-associated protein